MDQGVAAGERAALTEALVAAGNADRAAFRQVYDMTSAKLFGICLRICGERGAAQDVLSEVYLTIWKRAGAYEPGRASPISWLATIARNRAIDWRRANPARATAPVELLDTMADDAPSASEQIEQDEEARRLHLCLDRLDGAQRDSIRAAFFGGLTYSELADRHSVPLGTMKSWIRRGLLRLKDCLDGI